MAKFMEKFYDYSVPVIFVLGVILVVLCPIYPWYKAYTESEKWLYFWYGLWMLCIGFVFQVFGYSCVSFVEKESAKFFFSLLGVCCTLIPLYLSTIGNFRDFFENTSDGIISSAKQYGMIEARHIQAMPYEKVLPHQKENMTQHVGFDVRYESKVSVLSNGNSKMVYLDVYHPTYPHRCKGNGDRAAEPVYSTVINIAVTDGKKICQVISEKSYTPPPPRHTYHPPIIGPIIH